MNLRGKCGHLSVRVIIPIRVGRIERIIIIVFVVVVVVVYDKWFKRSSGPRLTITCLSTVAHLAPPTIYQTSRRVVPPDLDVASLEKFFAAKPLKIRLRPGQDKTSKLLGNTIVCTSKPFISSLQNVCPLFFFVTYFSSPLLLLLLFFALPPPIIEVEECVAMLQCRVASLGRFLGCWWFTNVARYLCLRSVLKPRFLSFVCVCVVRI